MCSLICWCPQLRQAVWQHLPGCSAHLRLWGWSHEAWEMQGTQTRVMWGLVEETSGISHYFERVRKICATLCRQSIRLLWASKVQVILKQTLRFVDSDDCLPNALHPSWTDYRLLFAKSASPHHGFAAFYTYLEFIFKVPQFFWFNWLWAQHLAST